MLWTAFQVWLGYHLVESAGAIGIGIVIGVAAWWVDKKLDVMGWLRDKMHPNG